MIRLNDIVVKFGDFTALHSINVHVKEGEFFTFLGPSGCGKTTTLRTITGFIEPAEGSVVVKGRDITRVPIEDRNIGIVFQSYALFPTMTVYDNIAFGLKVKKAKKDEIDRKVREIARKVDLSDEQLKKAVSQLSGGQQQRVAIARALATNPKILLCDEATSALDPTTTRSILALLKEINKTLGITIIVITHEMAVIEEICQRVAIIDSSRIAEVGAVDDVFTRPQSAMAKQLIYPDGKRRALATGKRYCRIVFDGNSSFEPVVSNMVLECKAPVNIMFADTKNIDGKAYGQMILQLPEDERAAKRALAYLETQNVHTEEVDANAAV